METLIMPKIARPQSVNFPSGMSNGSTPVTTDTGVIVIVGANGSGKSRLGAWIELDGKQSITVHRVSAQKVLEIPDDRAPQNVKNARMHLFGYSEEELNHHDDRHAQLKRTRRWGSNPYTRTLNDYQSLLTYLFFEHNELAVRYKQDSRMNSTRVEPPISKLERAQEIWESVIPHRQLDIGATQLRVRTTDSAVEYDASDMSDGERVILYLAGESLAAEPSSIIIVDEPELHLHRSIQSRLWDAIEATRSDCIFIYLTHDLEFAATRQGATKILVEDYDGQKWDWSVIESIDGLPESVTLAILGSRKPILFVEGTADSLDYSIYSAIFPDRSIVPVGSCAHVIHATATFSDLPQMHRLSCAGIVDLDSRPREKIDWLRQRNVIVLEYAEIENLLLAEDVIRAIAEAQSRTDIDQLVEQVKSDVLTRIKNQREQIIIALTGRKLQSIIEHFAPDMKNIETVEQSVIDFNRQLNVDSIRTEATHLVDRIIADQDYELALRVYENKGLVREISKRFGFRPREYVQFIRRHIQHANGEKLRMVIKSLIPELPATGSLSPTEIDQQPNI